VKGKSIPIGIGKVKGQFPLTAQRFLKRRLSERKEHPDWYREGQGSIPFNGAIELQNVQECDATKAQ
jgi:hypothetical protein